MHCDAVCNLMDFLLSNVVHWWVVLGAVVANACGAGGPEEMELAL